MNAALQILVITKPIGKIRILSPGTTKGSFPVTTSVWIGGCRRDCVGVTWAAKTPFTKVAWSDEREVLTFAPTASVPVRVTTGTRTFWRAALAELLVCGSAGEALYLRSHWHC